MSKRRKSFRSYEERKTKKLWYEVVKVDMKKKGLCINDAQDRNK